MTMKRPAVASDLIDYLNAQIMTGVYLPGSRIPSVRSLMKRFNLCYSSALNGIDYLCDIGRLEKSPKRGVFVRGTVPMPVGTGKGVIGVISQEQYPEAENTLPPGLIATAFSAIYRMAMQLNYPVLSIPVASSYTLRENPSVFQHCDALILFKGIDFELDSLPLELPMVGIMVENDFGGRLSIVEIDPFNTARQAIEYFTAHGVRRLNIITDRQPAYWNRGKILEFNWLHLGNTIGDFIATNAQIPGLDHYDFREEEGYFFTSGHLYERCARPFLERTGRQLSEHSHVLAVDGKHLLRPDFCPVPTIAVDWKLMGRTALEEAISRLTNPARPPRRIYLHGTLLPGGVLSPQSTILAV